MVGQAGQPLGRHLPARDGAGGDIDRTAREAATQFANQPGGGDHFAHGNGVQPDAARNRLAVGELAEAFRQVRTPIGPPERAPRDVKRKQGKPQPEQQPVKEQNEKQVPVGYLKCFRAGG